MPAFEPLAAPAPIEHAPVPSPEDVASALASLSSGSIGTAAAEEVAVNPRPSHPYRTGARVYPTRRFTGRDLCEDTNHQRPFA
jgi:hypothetical protein